MARAGGDWRCVVTLRIVPCTAKQEQQWIRDHHRHLPRVGMSRFAVAVADETGIRGVGIVGNAKALDVLRRPDLPHRLLALSPARSAEPVEVVLEPGGVTPPGKPSSSDFARPSSDVELAG